MTTSSHPAPGCRRLERQRRRERRRPIPAHIRQRNDTVLQHLGLAHLGANRQLLRGCGERDDLLQEGCCGLIQAVERFEASRGLRISSYAMSAITGRILHFRRDRLNTLRIPWRLGDLHARGMKLQTKRLHAGLEPLGDNDIAQKLGVTSQRWHQACLAHRERHLVSLDARTGGGSDNADDARFELIDRTGGPTPQSTDPQRSWLLEILREMEPNRYRWLCAHWIDGVTLTELARREQVDRRTVQRILRDTLNHLRLQSNRDDVSQPEPATRLLPLRVQQPRPSADH